ncbi:MAG: hypothetical protein ACUVQV_08295 [Dissulfurimicrobium sp.]|uniref:hypothetical protein n=1 Tax=Dissulfurimicrobium sp. TaxID=2022436 RepID=UPI00404B6743
MNWEDIFSDALWRGEDKRTMAHTAAGALWAFPWKGEMQRLLPILAKTGRCFVAHNELASLRIH